ncbi:uncharacterized protein si:dkey-171c9.3 [Conger conger]|uniref:uncharacterized protein si:dkey-171c9.3 n=1 Tax=Conger conger TaxID=82655 RepID=UPI002A59A70E|nr:uncharacterized protein si:dkey-171c9.3 [Conger conger]
MSDEMAKGWLSSSVRLCELRTATVDQPGQGLRDAVFNSSSFPKPAYQRSSVLNSLEMYTQALRQAGMGFTTGGRRVGMDQHIRAEGIDMFAHCLAGDILQSARGRWGAAQTEGYQPRGSKVGPPFDHVSGGTNPPEMGLREGLSCRSSGGPELCSTVLKSLLGEVAGERRFQKPRHRSKSAPDPMGQIPQAKAVEVFGGWRMGCRPEQGSLSCCSPLQDQREVEEHMDLCDDIVDQHNQHWRPRCASKEHPACWFSGSAGGQETKIEDRSGQRCFPGSPPHAGASYSILAHTGLPSKGSLDYPDAPPTTPLLPEMIRSHGSFHRKLKGSLAKEFLPSPPPPTPKYLPCICEEDRLGLRDDRAEFVARLMRSLSLECSDRGALGVEEEWTGAERRHQETPRLSAYASQLSAKIISLATTSCAAHFKDQGARMDPGKWLQLTAEQWANEVMTDSFLELMKEDTTEWVESRPPVQAHKMAERWPGSSLYPAMCSDTAVGHKPEDISPQQSRNQAPHASQTDDLCSFAGQLIANILRQARAELGTPSNLGQCLVQEMAKELCNSIVAEAVTIATWQQNARWKTPGSLEESCNCSSGKLGAMASISPQLGMTKPCYVTSLVEAVVRDSVQEAVRLDMGLTGASADQDPRLGNPMGSEVRAFLDTSACLGTQVLQGMLLWATASNLGSPTLQLTVQDVQLQAEFSMLAYRALQAGWTVGDLMTSLWQYCELEDNLAGSGRSLNDTSLLRYLQEKLVAEMTDLEELRQCVLHTDIAKHHVDIM